MSERRNNERRKWGRKVTYPFIDSDGVLVTKNRRRLVDRRLAKTDAAEDNAESPKKSLPPTLSDVQPSLDISESKAMELENALKEEDSPATPLEASIKDLESQILTQTEKVESSIEEKDAKSGKVASSIEEDVKSNNESTETSKVDAKTTEKAGPLPAVEEDKNSTSIEISFNGDKHVLSDENTFVVGRDPTCDITIQGKYVSRAHAKIFCKEGKFLLQDESFNGTYIKFTNGQKIHVTKNEQTLISDGVMCMGEPVKDDKKSVIEFKILE